MAIFSTLVLVTTLIANVCLYIKPCAHKIAYTLTRPVVLTTTTLCHKLEPFTIGAFFPLYCYLFI